MQPDHHRINTHFVATSASIGYDEIMETGSERILGLFEEIAQIPRCSKNEGRIAEWITRWASAHGFEYRRDQVGNVLVAVPGTKGREREPAVVLQGHLDMVCEKTPDSSHDFDRDPIVTRRDGEWLTAAGTTLGADNGIGVAMALALAEDPAVAHPPLELLFTVDEETGLIGANSLGGDFLEGRQLINLDSEDEGVFTIGCAGGNETEISLPIEREPRPDGYRRMRLRVSGLLGGHSGADIHLLRGNANILLARMLREPVERMSVRVISLSGGKAHNAIPRDASAELLVPPAGVDELRRQSTDWQARFRDELGRTEKDLAVTLEDASDAGEQPWSASTARKVLNLVLALPNGVLRMSPDIEGLVETSSNLAALAVEGDELRILTSQRSSRQSQLEEATVKHEAAAALAGGSCTRNNGYPGWLPDIDSALLARCIETYRSAFGKAPVVEAIHAGLECGIIGAKYPGMDMVSLGPTIRDPHSPRERLHIPSLEQVRVFLVRLLSAD